MSSASKTLKPTEVPEEAIEQLAESLGIGSDGALDLIMFEFRESVSAARAGK
jgi:hypothetical protein